MKSEKCLSIRRIIAVFLPGQLGKLSQSLYNVKRGEGSLASPSRAWPVRLPFGVLTPCSFVAFRFFFGGEQ